MRTWFAVLCLFVVSLCRAQEGVVSLTLPECVERALQNNLDISIERINPEIQSATVLSAYGDFDPHLRLLWNQSDVEAARFNIDTNSVAIRTRATDYNPSLEGKLPTGTSYDFAYDTTLKATAP